MRSKILNKALEFLFCFILLVVFIGLLLGAMLFLTQWVLEGNFDMLPSGYRLWFAVALIPSIIISLSFTFRKEDLNEPTTNS